MGSRSLGPLVGVGAPDCASGSLARLKERDLLTLTVSSEYSGPGAGEGASSDWRDEGPGVAGLNREKSDFIDVAQWYAGLLVVMMEVVDRVEWKSRMEEDGGGWGDGSGSPLVGMGRNGSRMRKVAGSVTWDGWMDG